MNKEQLPKVVPIAKIEDENEIVKNFYFDISIDSKPGQFVMLWMPGVDEKPISIALDDGKQLVLTICSRGKTTQEMAKMKPGDKLGIRGPFGTNFHIQEGETLALVGGGYGAAPLYFVAYEAAKKGCKIEFIEGARSKDHLVYIDKLKALKNVNLQVATDDGSVGIKGYNTIILKKLLEEKKIDKIMTCGPELMMQSVGEIGETKGVNTFVSIERYMKCGFGVCGQCVVDPLGIRTCVSGPVMNYKVAKMFDDFGKYHRDSVGKKEYFITPKKDDCTPSCGDSAEGECR
ncbi:dihydroorotate dehydrogenase electron transfer subunit [Patescibacteria group bacterium]